jgi:lipase
MERTMIAHTLYGSGSGSPDAPTVLMIHGITAHSLSWAVVADLLPQWRIIAVDLRGRGHSGELPGPFGLRRHAEDLSDLADEVGVSSAVVAGHSMGGFVAVALAALRPDLVNDLVLVDGGLPLAPPPPGTDIETLLGPAAARLKTEFATPDAYLKLWRAHPALQREWRPEIEAYARYDLTGAEPHLRSSASADAMVTDGAELYGPDWYLDALRGIRVPVEILRAQRGLLDADPLYAPRRLVTFTELVPQLVVTEVPDVNHYTILFSDRGARAVADAINRTMTKESA